MQMQDQGPDPLSEAIILKAAAIGTSLILMILLLLLPANPARAEGPEEGYGLLWSHETGDDVYDVSVSADGSFIAAGSVDKKVYFFNREGELLWSYETGHWVFDISISADGSFIAAGSVDKKVYFFNREGKLLWSYETGGFVRDVSVSADGSFIAAGSYDDKVYFFISLSALRSLLDEVSASIAQVKAKGFDVAKAEELLAQAEKAFQARDYQSARSLALRAKSVALDIDGDGVGNEEDFAPTVNNYYIYGGGVVILAALLVGTGLAINSKRMKKKLKAQRIEREKSEIIGMIEETLRK